MEAVVLHSVAFLEYFCPKQRQDFKPSAAPLYPNMGQVSPPWDPEVLTWVTRQAMRKQRSFNTTTTREQTNMNQKHDIIFSSATPIEARILIHKAKKKY